MQVDALVIGGGILGATAAYYLARRGVSVLLAEKGALGGDATSTSTAGITLQYRTPERLPLYLAAARYWEGLEAELGADLGLVRCGSLSVAETPELFAEREAQLGPLRDLGLAVEMLTGAEAQRMAPWLGDGLAGASFCPADGYAEPSLVPQAFAAAAERLGATLWPDCEVQALRPANGGGFWAQTNRGEVQARRVVNAAGAWAGRVAGLLGLDLPVSLDPLHALATPAAAPWMDRVVLHVSRKLTLKQMRDGRVIIGGGWPADGSLNGGARSVRPENREANLRLAYRAVPRLAGLGVASEWVGLEGRSPDRYPFFGEAAAVPSFFMLACVHGGFTLGPLLGDQLAELMVAGRTTFPMRGFVCREFVERHARPLG